MVKTRLIPVLGRTGSAALQARLIEHTLATACTAQIGPVELWCTPDCDDPFLRSCAIRYSVPLRAQPGGDLGARMQAALDHTLRTNGRPILIGTDCPALTARHLQDTERELWDGLDAVFIPAEDGGYALIALNRCAPELFSGIEWGGANVMNETRRRLSLLGWRWRELEPLWDVDRPADYERLFASGLMRIFPDGTGS
jgi:rSAM/selenodomain-associated transferase 1